MVQNPTQEFNNLAGSSEFKITNKVVSIIKKKSSKKRILWNDLNKDSKKNEQAEPSVY